MTIRVGNEGTTDRSNTQHKLFDPFNDRLSRDIRNSLSEAMGDALRIMDAHVFTEAADNWLASEIPHDHRHYIEDRSGRFERAFDKIVEFNSSELLNKAMVMWNHGLFFEFHEVVESLWKKVGGNHRTALKGLIQAAGVWVHMDSGNRRAAEKLARKALRNIRFGREYLTACTNIDDLLTSLELLETEAPLLEFDP